MQLRGNSYRARAVRVGEVSEEERGRGQGMRCLCRKFENSTSGLISRSSRYSLLILSVSVRLPSRGGTSPAPVEPRNYPASLSRSPEPPPVRAAAATTTPTDRPALLARSSNVSNEPACVLISAAPLTALYRAFVRGIYGK